MPTTSTVPTTPAVTTTSRWPKSFKPFKPGAFTAAELGTCSLIVKNLLLLDSSSFPSPLSRSLNSKLTSLGTSPVFPTTSSRTPLHTAMSMLGRSSISSAHEKAIEALSNPLYRLSKLPLYSSSSFPLTYHTGHKMGPRSRLDTWATVLGLIGIFVGMPDLFLVTITLRAGEDPDTVCTSLKDKIEKTCLVPFLHVGVYVPEILHTDAHLHLLVCGREGDRESRALQRFALERNRRSGRSTSADVREVDDLDGLIRPRGTWDGFLGHMTSRTGYLGGDRNLTQPGGKVCASQLVHRLAHDLLDAGRPEIWRLQSHLQWLAGP